MDDYLIPEDDYLIPDFGIKLSETKRQGDTIKNFLDGFEHAAEALIGDLGEFLVTFTTYSRPDFAHDHYMKYKRDESGTLQKTSWGVSSRPIRKSDG